MKRRWQRVGVALATALLPIVACAATGPPEPGARPWALEGQLVFQHLAELETMAVGAIAQDPQGFLWFGTQTTLLRWDGVRLRSYARNPEASGSLADNFIRSLLVDESGRIWVGSNSGGLSRYDPQTDGFDNLPIGAGGTRDGNITALASDGHGGLWIGTGHGVDHLDGSSGHIDPPRAGDPRASTLALLLDRDGALWAGTRKGLLRRGRLDGEFRPFGLPTPDGSVPMIRSLLQDSAGRIWIGTSLYGAYVLESGSDQPRRLLENPASNQPLAESVAAMREAGQGEVWLGTEDSGIVRIDTRSWQVRREQSESSRYGSLPSNQVSALFADHEGRIWIGTTGAPISRVEPKQRLVQTFYGGNKPGRVLDDTSVSALKSFPDGRVWMALGAGGVEIVDPVAGRVGRIRAEPDEPDHALPKAQVVTMARWPDGSVFLGTAAGLFRASADGASVQRLQVPGLSRTVDVRALLAAQGRLWMGGLDGLMQIGVGSGGTLEVQRQWAAELADARVRTLVDGLDRGIWIGTPSGAARLDPATGAIAPLPIDPKNPGELPGGYVGSLLTDHQGRLWVATFGRGIEVEQGRDPDGRPVFRRLTQADGLPQNSVDALLLDADGNVWASTDGGLARIEASGLSIRAFGAAQGVGLEGFFTGVAEATPAGDLLFGGVDGLVVVHPARIAPAAASAAIVPTDVRVGGRSLAPSPSLARAGLQLDARERGLSIEFAALDFDDPLSRRYGYRLQGFDADWIETPAARRLAAYTNLPPGDYVLQLRSAAAGAPWAPPLDIPVHVQPAWYEISWVRLLAVLAALAGMLGILQMRTAFLRRRQAELERMVAERTAQLRSSQEYLATMAYMDALTGLPNRRMFNDQLRRMIAGCERGQDSFALLLIDLDGFKRINDTLGHDTGDGVLIEIARRIQSLIRETDLAARLGGDEFSVILAQTNDRSEVDAACARIARKLREPIGHSGHVVAISASIGVAWLCDELATTEELFQAADAALYEAKNSGRSTWRWNRKAVALAGVDPS